MRWKDVARVVGLVVATGIVSQDARAEIIPPDGSYAGRTYTEWEVLWWQTIYSIPVVGGDHPLISGGAFGGVDGVLFLTGVVDGATFDLSISPGTALFLPILNVECSVLEPDPFHGDDEASLRACANGHIDTATGLFASLDGESVDNLGDFRFESPLFEFGPLPDNNVFQFFGLDAPEGTTSPAVDAGYYLLIAPLGAGRHELRFGGTVDSLGASIGATYRINVVPEPPAVALTGVGLFGLLAWVGSRRRATVRAEGG